MITHLRCGLKSKTTFRSSTKTDTFSKNGAAKIKHQNNVMYTYTFNVTLLIEGRKGEKIHLSNVRTYNKGLHNVLSFMTFISVDDVSNNIESSDRN